MAGDMTMQREGEQALLASLRELIEEAGHGGAARQLGIDRKTLWRALDSGRLTPRVRQALERRVDNPEAARRRSRVDALDRRTAMLDKDVEALAEAVEALREEFGRLADLQARRCGRGSAGSRRWSRGWRPGPRRASRPTGTTPRS